MMFTCVFHCTVICKCIEIGIVMSSGIDDYIVICTRTEGCIVICTGTELHFNMARKDDNM